MKSHIDKAINYLQLYKLGHEPEYLVMANREIKKEVSLIKSLSVSRETGERKKAKDAGTSLAK